jgi:hypothetical protein
MSAEIHSMNHPDFGSDLSKESCFSYRGLEVEAASKVLKAKNE